MAKKMSEVRLELHSTVCRREDYSLRVNGTHLLEMLRACGHVIPRDHRVKVEFVVPGGGDWSNTAVDVDDENPVVVSWVVESVDTTEETK